MFSRCFSNIMCVFFLILDFSRCFNDVSLVILIHHHPFCWSHTYPSALTELESQTSKVQGLKCMFKTCEIVEDSGKRHVSAFNSLVPEVIKFFAFRRYKLEWDWFIVFQTFGHISSPQFGFLVLMEVSLLQFYTLGDQACVQSKILASSSRLDFAVMGFHFLQNLGSGSGELPQEPLKSYLKSFKNPLKP